MATNITEFSKLVASDVLHCPDELLLFQTINTLIDFCDKTWLISKNLNFEIDSIDIEEDINNYVDFDIREFVTDLKPFAVLDFKIDGVSYNFRRESVESNISDMQTVKYRSEKYFDFVNNYILRVFEISANSSNLFVKLAFKPLRASTTVPDILYEDWLEPLLSGIKARLQSLPNKPWTDLESAQINYNTYRRGISRAKMIVNKGHTRNSTHVKPQSHRLWI